MTGAPDSAGAGVLPYHIPVMPREVVAWMADTPEGALVDATLGGGGHTALLAQATPASRNIVGVDQDRFALEAARRRISGGGAPPNRFTMLQGNFAELRALFEAAGLPWKNALAAILLDLGVSSRQLDDAGRGFGLKHPDGPLDMRMDQDSDRPTAAELLASWSEDELTQVLREYGEVSDARTVARAIRRALAEGRLSTTGDLARAVEAVQKPWRSRQATHPATTVFQAIRIAVNGELEQIDRALPGAWALLRENGRFAGISFHSLEDRRVKRFLAERARGCICPPDLPVCACGRTAEAALLSRRSVTPSADEIADNPRAASARLRAARKLRPEERA